MLVKIIRTADEWLNPAQIIERNKLVGYTVEWIADNVKFPRENLWEISGKPEAETLADFAILSPEVFTSEWPEYVDNYDTVQILKNNKFTKLQIRRAMRSLGIEAILDGLLTNEAFAKDWADAIEIDLSDPLTAQALSYVNVDINAVKIAIANL